MKNAQIRKRRESNTKADLKHQYLRGIHKKKWLGKEWEKPGTFSDVKGRKHVKEWRAVKVKDKNTQTVLSSSGVSKCHITMDPSVKELGRKREDW